MQPSTVLKAGQLLLFVALLCCHLASGNPTKQSYVEDDPIDTISTFAVGQVCKADEILMAGQHPSCEPTCDDPCPLCRKMFYQSLDFVPCFCNPSKGLVRHTETRRCIPLEECPNKPIFPCPQGRKPQLVSRQ